ncbi:glucose-fructose oxidoreductase [Flavobacteriaceae bacterium MAR_2010_188]|nr:glucose-fructose oxidoreductase [Flavobacteriaceae bacterium MAR_2010_188]
MENRRDFLKKTALVLAATSVPLAHFGCSKNERKLGVALAGLGYYSTDLLAPALQLTEHCELRGVVTGSPEKVPLWQKDYGIKDTNVYNYGTINEMANNDEIDIVYIVTPNALHKEHAIAAANAGKHVWCEKPMATSAEDCQAIIDACKKNNVRLMVGYRMQHEPVTQKIIEWSKTKPYGDITSLEAEAGYYTDGSYRNKWRLLKELGGGAMFDMGVYSLNGARYATGLEPISVSAQQKIYRTDVFEADEETTFELEFPSGIRAKCKTSFAENINKLDVKCKNGSYKVAPMQSYTGVRATSSDGKVLNPFNGNQQAKQMDDDAIAIKKNQPAIVPGEEGLRDIRIVDAIFKSANNNGKLIKL